jgi:pyruvate/2-oxoglutarate/acetoin dehydrogenase E1 component
MSTQTDGGGAEVLSYREAITAALADAMEDDPAVLLMGEDVANAGGIFKTNDGLIERFGQDRVINTPICENGFVGVALGMSLMGLRPVVEIMFADFLLMAGDAIVNQLAKYRYMSGGQCATPVTLRVISGGTGRFGSQHSASGESLFMGQPGLRVAAASSPGSAYALLRAAIEDNNPVLVHEHKGLYGRKGPVDRNSPAEIGKAAVIRGGADVTIVATMLMLDRAVSAAEALADDQISAEVIDLRWIRPLDVETVAASVGRTRRLVVVEEQPHAGGWGATLISELAIRGVELAGPPIAVSLPGGLVMPYSPPLEDAMIPSSDAIADAVKTALRA